LARCNKPEGEAGGRVLSFADEVTDIAAAEGQGRAMQSIRSQVSHWLRSWGTEQGRRFVAKRIAGSSIIFAVCMSVVCPSKAQVHYRGYRGLACYADTTAGWEFGLTGQEVSVAVALKQFESCGLNPTREQVNEIVNRMAGSVGKKLVLREIYFNWRDELDRIERLEKESKARGATCQEKPVRHRYLGCFLRLPGASRRLRVSLAGNLQVTMTVVNRSGIAEEIVSDAIYATDDDWRQDYFWNSARDGAIRADPQHLFSKTNEETGRTSIILLVMVKDAFKRVEDVKKVKLSGLQVLRG
jgi:hypothetical protein